MKIRRTAAPMQRAAQQAQVWPDGVEDMRDKLPGAAGALAGDHPDIWQAYSALGRTTAEAGPLTARERRLVKLALAIGAGSEGAVHSHTRRGLEEGLERAALDQVALLAIGTLGLPRAVAARSWIDDIDG